MRSRWMRWMVVACLLAGAAAGAAVASSADAPALGDRQRRPQEQPARRVGGESSLILPDLSSVLFHGIDGHTLLLGGLLICALGGLFGLVINTQLKNMPVHASMREISELIYETCKTYLTQQGKFLMILWLFIGAIAGLYFGTLAETVDAAGNVVRGFPLPTVAIILFFSLVGIAGSYGVAWFGIRVNTYANSRTAFAALARQAVSLLCHSAQGGHEHRHAPDLGRAGDHADHPALHPR